MSTGQASPDPQGLPEASLGESLRVLRAGMMPTLIRGLFKPRPGAVRLLAAANADGRTVTALSRLRRAHPGQGARLLGGRMVVLWGLDAIREVLDRSAELYASDSGAKGRGMAHFQPDALTISRGEEWRDRRAFNESVLATSEHAHPLADRFLAVVADEVERLRLGGRTLEWPVWEAFFDHVTLRVIFGDRSRGDHRLTERLEKLMGEANRLVGLGDADDLHELHGDLERHLREPEPGSLLSRFAEAPQSDRTRIVHQIPHWMFAMRDTLGANTLRALAVIAADADVEHRVLEEASGADLTDPSTIVGLRYLEGCLQEAMRLWPTVPLIARETTRETTLAGETLAQGTQVMIVNTFTHRDRERVPDADRFVPDRWDVEGRDYRYNHLSNGSQDCPGGPLVFLLGKAVLAGVLRDYRLALREPSLPAGGDMPHMLDFFRIRLDAEPRAAA